MAVWTNIPGGGPFGSWSTRVGGMRSDFRSFPKWGVPLVLLAAVPSALIALLSILLLGASLLALFLLTLPVYKLVSVIGGTGRPASEPDPADPLGASVNYGPPSGYGSPGSKPIEVRVTETSPGEP